MKQIILTSIVAACFGTAMAAQTPSGVPGAGIARQPERPLISPRPFSRAASTGKRTSPAGRPNVAERAGVHGGLHPGRREAQAQLPSAGSSTATPGGDWDGGTMAAKAGTMYKLEKIADEQLRAAVGKRVEVTGRIDAEAGDETGARGRHACNHPDRSGHRTRPRRSAGVRGDIDAGGRRQLPGNARRRRSALTRCRPCGGEPTMRLSAAAVLSPFHVARQRPHASRVTPYAAGRQTRDARCHHRSPVHPGATAQVRRNGAVHRAARDGAQRAGSRRGGLRQR